LPGNDLPARTAPSLSANVVGARYGLHVASDTTGIHSIKRLALVIYRASGLIRLSSAPAQQLAPQTTTRTKTVS